MLAKQRAWVKRVSRLIEFMSYEWAKDEKWLAYYQQQGPKRVKSEDPKVRRQEEEGMKRAYYGS